MKAISLSEFVYSLKITQIALLDKLKINYDNAHTTIILIGYYNTFLSQPFKPELITELFEGWTFIQDGYYISNKNSIDFDNWEYPIPKTLGDFILFCSYADIELNFKEQK